MDVWLPTFSTCINSKLDCVGDPCNVTECDEDHFVCEGHHKFRCLRNDYICDGVIDCPNGIDEENCSMYFLILHITFSVCDIE